MTRTPLPVIPLADTPTSTNTPVPMSLQIQVIVYNSAGEAVMVLFEGSAQSLPNQIKYSGTSFVAGSGSVSVDYGTMLSNGQGALVWGGISQSGQSVEGGIYMIKTELIDSYGKVSEYAQQIQILAAPPSALINVYNSAGELVYSEALSSPGGSITGLDLDNQVLVLDSPSSPGVKLSGTLHSNAGPKAWTWDGKNNQGQQVAPGVYEISLAAGQGSGSSGAALVKSIQVMAAEGGQVLTLKPVVAPNPVTDAWLKAGNPLVLRFIPSGGTLAGRLYNLAGELVSTASTAASSGQMKFYPGPVASGVYIIALDYVSSQGAKSRMNLKLVILR